MGTTWSLSKMLRSSKSSPPLQLQGTSSRSSLKFGFPVRVFQPFLDSLPRVCLLCFFFRLPASDFSGGTFTATPRGTCCTATTTLFVLGRQQQDHKNKASRTTRSSTSKAYRELRQISRSAGILNVADSSDKTKSTTENQNASPAVRQMSIGGNPVQLPGAARPNAAGEEEDESSEVKRRLPGLYNYNQSHPPDGGNHQIEQNVDDALAPEVELSRSSPSTGGTTMITQAGGPSSASGNNNAANLNDKNAQGSYSTTSSTGGAIVQNSPGIAAPRNFQQEPEEPQQPKDPSVVATSEHEQPSPLLSSSMNSNDVGGAAGAAPPPPYDTRYGYLFDPRYDNMTIQEWRKIQKNDEAKRMGIEKMFTGDDLRKGKRGHETSLAYGLRHPPDVTPQEWQRFDYLLNNVTALNENLAVVFKRMRERAVTDEQLVLKLHANVLLEAENYDVMVLVLLSVTYLMLILGTCLPCNIVFSRPHLLPENFPKKGTLSNVTQRQDTVAGQLWSVSLILFALALLFTAYPLHIYPAWIPMTDKDYNGLLQPLVNSAPENFWRSVWYVVPAVGFFLTGAIPSLTDKTQPRWLSSSRFATSSPSVVPRPDGTLTHIGGRGGKMSGSNRRRGEGEAAGGGPPDGDVDSQLDSLLPSISKTSPGHLPNKNVALIPEIEQGGDSDNYSSGGTPAAATTPRSASSPRSQLLNKQSSKARLDAKNEAKNKIIASVGNKFSKSVVDKRGEDSLARATLDISASPGELQAEEDARARAKAEALVAAKQEMMTVETLKPNIWEPVSFVEVSNDLNDGDRGRSTDQPQQAQLRLQELDTEVDTTFWGYMHALHGTSAMLAMTALLFFENYQLFYGECVSFFSDDDGDADGSSLNFHSNEVKCPGYTWSINVLRSEGRVWQPIRAVILLLAWAAFVVFAFGTQLPLLLMSDLPIGVAKISFLAEVLLLYLVLALPIIQVFSQVTASGRSDGTSLMRSFNWMTHEDFHWNRRWVNHTDQDSIWADTFAGPVDPSNPLDLPPDINKWQPPQHAREALAQAAQLQLRP
ncbi:unnamed protein product [Amoebophrya sp. A120]|nr:unnamed protein product [Amoebophrya sp. A120]|eukprot:GSA120T00008056001.1